MMDNNTPSVYINYIPNHMSSIERMPTTHIVSNKKIPNVLDSPSLLLQKAASIGFWEFNPKSNHLYWSSVTKEIHGVSPDFIPNVDEALNFYKEGIHRNRISIDFINCIEKDINFDNEYLIITRDGSEKWIRSIGIPIFENGVCTKIYGVFQDIDSQKNAKIKLKNNEQRFRQTFEHAPNGIALVSLKGKWMRTNKRIEQIFGYSKQELFEYTLDDVTHKADRYKDQLKIKKLLAGLIDEYQSEVRYVNKTGDVVWCVLSVSLIRESNQAPSYFIVHITDISSVKKAKHKIQALLTKTASQNEKLLNFKHIVSHNLRSHTSNLEMLLQFLQQDMPDLEETEIFILVQEAFKNLKETIVNLSEVSEFEEISSNDFVEVNILDELKKCLVNVQAIIDEVNGEVVLNIPKDINLFVIPEYLRSCFLNLITNAIKYRKHNEKLRLNIHTKTEDNYQVISFSDNGIGVDLELHGDKIFGLYKTFHDRHDAKGLGLYIVKNQVEVMNGFINADSEVGVGSTFNLYLAK